MSGEIKISVRKLVEHVYRSGSIESGFRTSTSLTDGIKAHQKIQSTYDEKDEQEVMLKIEILLEEINFKIEGRCDGLLFDEDRITIDEIKSTSKPIETITEDTYPVHWAQAIFYGFIYATDESLSEIDIQLTYVQVNTDEQRKYKRTMSFHELESYVFKMLNLYMPYAEMLTEHLELRNESARSIAFPFSTYREGQYKFAGGVYKTITEKKDLFAKAATGIGKTMATLFPAIKAIGENKLERIFYLTAKTITRTMAEETMEVLNRSGLEMKVVTITAKNKVCFSDKPLQKNEHPCGYGEGHYDRINQAVLDIHKHESLMTRNVILKYADKHQVCPFEFSLDLAYVADVVICDYNYIFDPMVALQRLFEEQKKETALLIDEAHNLVDRGRSMYSATLHKSDFLNLSRAFQDKNKGLVKAAKAVNTHMLAKKKTMETTEKELDEELIKQLELFIILAEKELVTTDDSDEVLLELYFAAQKFVKIANLYGEQYITYLEAFKSEVKIKLFCLDPSDLLNKITKGYQAKVFFSATLEPANYYMTLLGGTAEDYVMSIPSPFPRENIDVTIKPLSTRYRDRPNTINQLVEMIIKTYERSSGNLLVFFPSYEYMLDAYDIFMNDASHINSIIQGQGMLETEREDFLNAFQPELVERLVGFAVLGGIFSEGVDLRGDRLNGVVVVGVGLPRMGLENKIIKDYFSNKGYNGFNYAYIYPGMNKVLQAGGRLIRSETDLGYLTLIDDRFLQQAYKKLLPDEWQDYKIEKP